MSTKDRYCLKIIKNNSVTELNFRTFQQIADHINTSLNTVRKLLEYSNGEIEQPRRSIRTKHFYEMYKVSEINI